MGLDQLDFFGAMPSVHLPSSLSSNGISARGVVEFSDRVMQHRGPDADFLRQLIDRVGFDRRVENSYLEPSSGIVF